MRGGAIGMVGVQTSGNNQTRYAQCHAARGRGIGAIVVSALLALYDRLGFTPMTDYVISYYGI